MKYKGFFSIVLGLMLFGCSYDTKSNTSAKKHSGTIKSSDDHKDKEEIQTLIRQMLKWADSKNTINLLPILSKDSICIGFDPDKQKQNLEKLKRTGFFADEFIANYDKIIQTLDKKIKNKEFEKWNIHELPTFNFSNDVNPWCLCQDNLSWDNVAIEIIKLKRDKGELKWNWGKLYSNTDSSWKEFSYAFRVVKVDTKWKISYLQGFDYNESIR